MSEQDTANNTISMLAAACIVLTLELCGLAAVCGLTVQENGRLQGEINRMESQLRSITTR